MTYEKKVALELQSWEASLHKPPGMLEKTSKTISGRINRIIPAKVHQALTAAVQGIVRTVLAGAQLTPKGKVLVGLSLEERDRRAGKLISDFQKIAAAEGAGTGAGGWVLGLVDFPALLAIKMKFLFELAHLYGYDTSDVRERLFLLHVFQLAFSGQSHRLRVYRTIKEWDAYVKTLPPGDRYLQTIDWTALQQEYRDSIDLRKLLQLVPGLGAIVGAWANFSFLDELGETGRNAFRLRILNQDSTGLSPIK
ncbi:EcsC family protein [Paenibacillus sp. CC-CFT747]|nr:EcsC family protein [Paenibacillus sp. CC-CFT747]